MEHQKALELILQLEEADSDAYDKLADDASKRIVSPMERIIDVISDVEDELEHRYRLITDLNISSVTAVRDVQMDKRSKTRQGLSDVPVAMETNGDGSVRLYLDDEAFVDNLPTGLSRENLEELDDYVRTYQAVVTMAAHDGCRDLFRNNPELKVLNVEAPTFGGQSVQVALFRNLDNPDVQPDKQYATNLVLEKRPSTLLDRVQRYLSNN